MRTDDTIQTDKAPSLLDADEPSPFSVLNAGSRVPVLLLCDHAADRIPRSLGDLGLDRAARNSHLAVDIGAGAVTRKLAASLSATAVLASYSRLVVDCNRDIDNPEAFLAFSDGVTIPGNRGLSETQKRLRTAHIARPYHDTVDAQIKRLWALDRSPAVYAIHSFTPVFENTARPWEIGVLWDGDERLAVPMINALRRARFVVGDNEPYAGTGPRNFTLNRHARRVGLPNVAIEIRQDLIDHDNGINRIVSLLHDIIASMPAFADPNGAGTATRLDS